MSINASTAGSVGMAMIIDWGDGTDTGSLAVTPDEITHVYSEPGEYIVTLRVQGQNGEWAERISRIVALSKEEAERPLSTMEVQYDQDTGDVLVSVGKREGVSCTLDWGDGSEPAVVAENITHFYEKPGRYEIELTSKNATRRSKASVTVDVKGERHDQT